MLFGWLTSLNMSSFPDWSINVSLSVAVRSCLPVMYSVIAATVSSPERFVR